MNDFPAWLNDGGSGIVGPFTGPRFLVIGTQVEINLENGSIEFLAGYDPDVAARKFWEHLSQDYRNMLKWKAEHEREQR